MNTSESPSALIRRTGEFDWTMFLFGIKAERISALRSSPGFIWPTFPTTVPPTLPRGHAGERSSVVIRDT